MVQTLVCVTNCPLITVKDSPLLMLDEDDECVATLMLFLIFLLPLPMDDAIISLLPALSVPSLLYSRKDFPDESRIFEFKGDISIPVPQE